MKQKQFNEFQPTSLVINPIILRPGDLLFRRLHNCESIIAYHYGCYAGIDKFGGHMVFEHRKSKKPSLVTFEEFALGYEVRHESILNIDRIAAIARMKELLSAGPGYNEVLFNCEQAARYVSEGKSYSWQIRGAFVFISLIVGLVILSKSEAA